MEYFNSLPTYLIRPACLVSEITFMQIYMHVCVCLHPEAINNQWHDFEFV